MSDEIEEILKFINEEDVIFWAIVAAAARTKDRDLLKLANNFSLWIRTIFNKVSALKGTV